MKALPPHIDTGEPFCNLPQTFNYNITPEMKKQYEAFIKFIEEMTPIFLRDPIFPRGPNGY